ncbi:MAG: YihY/virulence factor BrkB family protein [Rickettsiales bacterium]
MKNPFRQKTGFLACLIRATAAWHKRDPYTQSAAFAYYAIFSFPAAVIIYFAAASIFASKKQSYDRAHNFLSAKFGEEAAAQFETIVRNTTPHDVNFWAFAIGAGTLCFAAVKLFMQLQTALNAVWETSDAGAGGWKSLIVRRLMAFGVMLLTEAALAASLVVNAVLGWALEWLEAHLPDFFGALVHAASLSMSWATLAILFSLLLKWLPDAVVAWRHAFLGAAVAAALFIFSEYLLGVYFRVAEPASAYGVTGSLILLMLWTSYSCMTLLFGAEISRALSDEGKQAQSKSLKFHQ